MLGTHVASTQMQLVFLLYSHGLQTNPCIFRETKFQDRKFPDRTLQVGKLWDQNIPGIPICHGIWEKKFGENSRILF